MKGTESTCIALRVFSTGIGVEGKAAGREARRDASRLGWFELSK
jgi:hypothetical protein